MAKIIIQVQGGLVQDVFIKGRGKLTKAIVVDEDVENYVPKMITSVKLTEYQLGARNTKPATYKAHIHTEEITRLPKNSDVDKIVKEYERS